MSASSAKAQAFHIASLLLEAGISREEFLSFIGRSPRTWRNWTRVGFPLWVIQIARLRAGYLDALGWRGWKLDRGRLFAPDLRDPFTQGDLYAAWWHRQQLADVRKRERMVTPSYPRGGQVVTIAGRKEEERDPERRRRSPAVAGSG